MSQGFINKKVLLSGLIILLILIALITWLGVSYLKQFVGPAFLPPSQNISEIINTTGMPLKLPAGFSISIFAKNLPGARVMAFDTFGNMWVSQTGDGKISLLEIQNGTVANQNEVFKDLKKPHGLAFDPQNPFVLYFAEEDKISRVPTYSEGPPEKIIDLPSGGRHFTRTIKFGPDNRLYVSIGSSCDVCLETDERRAKIFSLNRDGGDFKEYARGLRNTVFFAWDYVYGKMWGTDMGRDFLGDDLPPDEINIIEAGNPSTGLRVKNYGWPICYGKNIHDTNFDKNTYIRNPCMEPFETSSYIDIPAHSAPLGLAFIPAASSASLAQGREEGWPEEYWHNLIVAYHGSWNRSKPTGYKLVRYKLDAQGNYLGEEDFISGWLQGSEALGRPVDVLAEPGGVMYVSDDKAGVIYKVTYNQEKKNADKSNLIRVVVPKPNELVKQPLIVKGEARGYWYFEASFPVKLLDGNGKEIALGIAQARGEWMTENFVPFEVKLDFTDPSTTTGTLILEKDNPSGLSKNADELRIPVRFR